jgi:hypothetical protein
VPPNGKWKSLDEAPLALKRPDIGDVWVTLEISTKSNTIIATFPKMAALFLWLLVRFAHPARAFRLGLGHPSEIINSFLRSANLQSSTRFFALPIVNRFAFSLDFQ